jgi:hypothetical protein
VRLPRQHPETPSHATRFSTAGGDSLVKGLVCQAGTGHRSLLLGFFAGTLIKSRKENGRLKEKARIFSNGSPRFSRGTPPGSGPAISKC